MENHGEKRTPKIYLLSCVYLLSDIEFAGYLAKHFDTQRLTFVRQKSTL